MQGFFYEPKAGLTPVTENTMPSLTQAVWIADGTAYSTGDGYWLLPNDVRVIGSSDWSQERVFAQAAAAGAWVSGASAPSASANPQSSGLTREGSQGALYIALGDAIISLIIIAFLYDFVRGVRPVSKARKYAAWASFTTAPFWMTICNELLLHRPLEAAFGRLVGLGIWGIIFMGAAYAFGSYQEKSQKFL